MVPQIVEIVGPAGAGKSSLCHALSDSTDNIHLGNFPDVRNISNAPFFIWNGLQLFPALFGLRRHLSRKISRREFAWLSILNGWPGILQRELRNSRVIFLNQGPVYLLTEVREFGPEYLRRQKTENLWRALYSRWSTTLDMIVWLDAADSELIVTYPKSRKEHLVKDESIETTLEFCFAIERLTSEQFPVCRQLILT